MVDRRVLKYKRRFFHSRKRSALDNVAMQKDCCTILRPIATSVLETGLYFVNDYVQLQFICHKTNVPTGSNPMK